MTNIHLYTVDEIASMIRDAEEANYKAKHDLYTEYERRIQDIDHAFEKRLHEIDALPTVVSSTGKSHD